MDIEENKEQEEKLVIRDYVEIKVVQDQPELEGHLVQLVQWVHVVKKVKPEVEDQLDVLVHVVIKDIWVNVVQ